MVPVNMAIFCLCLILLCSIIPTPISGDDKCPKVCSVCFNNHLSCTSGGLLAIPVNIHDSTTKIILIGHTFHSPTLSRQNFSSFSKPKYSIEQLSIRQSNIDTIERNTFFDLLGLDNLDLSDNRRINIHYMAFNNLKLKHLKLDKIHVLQFQKGAFDGCAVTSLSIINSRLKTLGFDLLHPISSNLRSLFLSNNLLTDLDQKFEKLILKLTNLELMGNPFQCFCKLTWLSRALEERIRSKELVENTFSYSGQDPNYPTCAGPPHVRNKYIHNISDNEFSCDPPSLDLIDIEFDKSDEVKLKCSAKVEFKKAPLQVFWKEISEFSTITRWLLEKPPPNKDVNQAVIVVKKTSDVTQFQCVAQSSSGNATIKITINWPPVENASKKEEKSRKNWIDHTNKQMEKNFLFRDQFTLLEMLGAVMGTFTVTLTIFLLLYKFCMKASTKVKKANSIKKSGYSIYEPAIYSDSQTYDVPQNNYSIQSPNAVNTSVVTNTPSHFLDYRTQQRITHQ